MSSYRPSCWNCCAATGEKSGRRNGCFPDKFLTNLYAGMLLAMPWLRPAGVLVSRSTRRRILCGTRTPFTYSKAALTSAEFNFCWVTGVCLPLPATSALRQRRFARQPARWICSRCPLLIQKPRPRVDAASPGSRRHRARPRRRVSPSACCLSLHPAEASVTLDRIVSHRGPRRSFGTM